MGDLARRLLLPFLPPVLGFGVFAALVLPGAGLSWARLLAAGAASLSATGAAVVVVLWSPTYRRVWRS